MAHEADNGTQKHLYQVCWQARPDAMVVADPDIVEAMASFRPYRPARGLGVALEEIESQAGTRLDVEVVRVCLSLFREKGPVIPGLNRD